jgi:acyl-CoA dehydrogenase
MAIATKALRQGAKRSIGRTRKTPQTRQNELLFETRSPRERELIEAVKRALATLSRERKEKEARGERLGSPLEILQKLMQGELSAYSDLILAQQGILPIRTDLMRQYVMYGEEATGEGESIPKSMARRKPAKFGLTAMGLAAIASGKDGRARMLSEFLPQVAQGKLFCYCITEPDAGTNTHRISTTAREVEDGYILNGRKTYISAADTAYYMVVIARIIKDGTDQGIGTFVIEKNTPGVTLTEMDIAVLGDRQFTVYFEDVKVPKSALVGAKSPTGSSKISQSVFITLNLERILVALVTLRICKEALARIYKKLRGMKKVPEPILVELARLKLRFELANLLTLKATRAYDENVELVRMGLFANMAKLITTETANECVLLGLRLYGLKGLDREEEDLGALYELARALRIIPINNEMLLNFLGENMLGMPKSYR